jgi:type IV pilus assembly protein PilC
VAKFSYTATKGGKTITGTLEASDKASVMDNLRKQGATPVIVKVARANRNPLKFNISRKKVKLKDLAVFTRQLSTMVSAGVPLNRSLTTLQSQTKSKYFQKVILDISKNIEGGMPLADAFGHYPNVFSEIYTNMVRAGEAGGILDEILKRLALQIEKDSSMRKKIKSAMAYPVVILSVTVVAFFGIMIFIIPKLGKIIKDLGGENARLPIYTEIMLSISDFLQHNALLVIGAFVIFIFLFRRYIRSPKGRYKFHYTLLKIPVVKNIMTKIAVARFARTFASLMSSGVGVLDALEVTGGAIGNKVIEKDLKEAANQVKNGKQLSVPLGQSQYFPPIVAQMLAVGEESGQIDTILIKVADFYEEEVEATIEGLSSLIEPLMIIILGALVGVIAASVMGPIASLSKNIQD